MGVVGGLHQQSVHELIEGNGLLHRVVWHTLGTVRRNPMVESAATRGFFESP